MVRVGLMNFDGALRARFFLLAAGLALLVQVTVARPVVALLTDFGQNNEAVGLCHGAIAAINSEILTVDLCHMVDAYDTQLAALMLKGTTGFPKGSVFVCVVDPGVGTKRKPVAVETKAGYFYVAPDNGVLTCVIRDQGVAGAVTLDEARINADWKPGTFDGRDLFSPAGALLASTSGSLERIGSPLDAGKLVQLEIPVATVDADSKQISGVCLRIDEPYGNVWTNIEADSITSAGVKLGEKLRMKAGGLSVDMPFVVSFGHVKEGEPLAYLNSGGSLAFAINMGDFRKKQELKPGIRITVEVVR